MPVAEGNRLSLIDGLRGVALLGILWINMTGHALPFFSMWDPRIAGGDDPLNLGAWTVSEVVIEGAMRGLFSLLFGVSILLFLKEGDRGALFVRRNFWLIVFGCIHGFLLLMPGDILVTYGVCAFLLFPFRNASPRLLAILSAAAVRIKYQVKWKKNVGGNWVDDASSEGLTIRLRKQQELTKDVLTRSADIKDVIIDIEASDVL